MSTSQVYSFLGYLILNLIPVILVICIFYFLFFHVRRNRNKPNRLIEIDEKLYLKLKEQAQQGQKSIHQLADEKIDTVKCDKDGGSTSQSENESYTHLVQISEDNFQLLKKVAEENGQTINEVLEIILSIEK